MRQAVRSGALHSAHDVAEGGLAVALAEACVAGGLGAEVDPSALAARGLREADALFGEGPGAFVVSGSTEALRAFGAAAVPLGTVGGDALVLGALAAVPVAELARVHAHGLADLLQ